MKSAILIAIAISYHAIGFAQSDSSAPEAADTTIPKSTFTIGTLYANSASYYGQKSEENTSYVALAATYRFKFGFYLTGLAYKLLKDSGLVSASSFGAGMDFKIGKKFSVDMNYSHSFFPAYSPLLQAGNPDNLGLTLAYENWLKFALSGDYAFGKSNDAFLTAEISKSFNLFSIGKKDIVTFNPSADIVAGTQHFYQTYLTEKKLRDSVLGIILEPITGDPSTGSSEKTVTTTAFNVLSYNFKFPIAYNRASYLIEANYQLSLLSKHAESGAGKTNSFFTLSFYYQF